MAGPVTWGGIACKYTIYGAIAKIGYQQLPQSIRDVIQESIPDISIPDMQDISSIPKRIYSWMKDLNDASTEEKNPLSTKGTDSIFLNGENNQEMETCPLEGYSGKINSSSTEMEVYSDKELRTASPLGSLRGNSRVKEPKGTFRFMHKTIDGSIGKNTNGLKKIVFKKNSEKALAPLNPKLEIVFKKNSEKALAPLNPKLEYVGRQIAKTISASPLSVITNSITTSTLRALTPSKLMTSLTTSAIADSIHSTVVSSLPTCEITNSINSTLVSSLPTSAITNSINSIVVSSLPTSVITDSINSTVVSSLPTSVITDSINSTVVSSLPTCAIPASIHSTSFIPLPFSMNPLQFTDPSTVAYVATGVTITGLTLAALHAYKKYKPQEPIQLNSNHHLTKVIPIENGIRIDMNSKKIKKLTELPLNAEASDDQSN